VGSQWRKLPIEIGKKTNQNERKRVRAGVILVRNSEKSAEILRVWDETSERPGLEDYRFGLSHEQDTCFQTIWQEYPHDVKLLTDYYLMNGSWGMFIRHLRGMKDEDRHGILKKFLMDRWGNPTREQSLFQTDYPERTSTRLVS